MSAQVESSSKGHAELPAFPIDTLKTWLKLEQYNWQSKEVEERGSVGARVYAGMRDAYVNTLHFIEKLEAEVKEGK